MAAKARRSAPKGHKHAKGGGPQGHHLEAEGAVRKAGAAVLTVSSTRTRETDESGDIIQAGFERAGHHVLYRGLAPDEMGAIEAEAQRALSTAGVDIVVVSGGTGMSKADVTWEALLPLIDKRAEGWSDVFRAISREEVGNAAFLSRSFAGLARGKWLVAIPGSAGAARTAMSKLILPELAHMLWEARR